MQKLKLQMQITLDGFVARPNGELDWMIPDTEASISKAITDPAESCDTIVMGRKMAPEFISYWENVMDNEPENPEHALASRMVNMRKIVFSRTQSSIKGRNVSVENNDLASVILRLKKENKKDIIVYGGAAFVNSLIELNLIDEYYFFTNPVAIGDGLSIFKGEKQLKLVTSTALKNGTVVNKYLPQ